MNKYLAEVKGDSKVLRGPVTVEKPADNNPNWFAHEVYETHLSSLPTISAEWLTEADNGRLLELNVDFKTRNEYGPENIIIGTIAVPIYKQGKAKLPACGCTDGEQCDGTCIVPKWIAERVLKAREAFLKKDYDEVYHQLYSIADPEFEKYEPWKDLEGIIKTKPQEDKQEGKTERMFTLDEMVAVARKFYVPAFHHRIEKYFKETFNIDL